MTGFFCFRSYNFLLVLVIRCCNSNLAIFTWSYFFSLTSFKIFIVDIFSVEWFFYNFCNWFCTNSNFSILFFSDSRSFFRSFSSTVSNFCSNSYFFLTNFSFTFYFFTSSIHSIVIDIFSFKRYFSFYSFYCWAFCNFCTYTNNMVFRLRVYFFA